MLILPVDFERGQILTSHKSYRRYVMKGLKLIVILVWIMSLILARVSWAEEKEEGKEVIELGEIVVTATRHKSPVANLPVSVTVITREQIEASNNLRVDHILRKYAGIDIRRPSGIVGRSTVSMRGMGNMPGRTLILLDGHPMNKADTGSVNWNLLQADISNV